MAMSWRFNQEVKSQGSTILNKRTRLSLYGLVMVSGDIISNAESEISHCKS